jgi:hypothetical protein
MQRIIILVGLMACTITACGTDDDANVITVREGTTFDAEPGDQVNVIMSDQSACNDMGGILVLIDGEVICKDVDY